MNKYTPEGTRISTIQNREYVSSLAGLEKALENGNQASMNHKMKMKFEYLNVANKN